MNFKLKELQELSNGLEQIIQIEMAQKTAYWLGRIHKKITSELKTYNESRAKLEKKYGSYKFKRGEEILTFKEDESGRGFWFNEKGEKIEGVQINPAEIYWKSNSDEDFSLYAKELEELENQEITTDISPINISELVRHEHGGQTAALNLRPKLLSDLEPIFTA